MHIALVTALHLPLAACTLTDAPKPGTSLTVYSSADPAGFDPRQFVQQQRMTGSDDVGGVPGYGVVKSVRKLAIAKGTSKVAFTDVAAWIDPTTVTFMDLEDPSTAVVEQSFQFDLVSPSKLLERYIDQPVTITLAMGEQAQQLSGTLLSANQGQAVLQADNAIRIVPLSDARVDLSQLPGGLMTRPTLMWTLSSPAGGDHLVRTTYQTAGMTWRADYSVVLDAAAKSADVSAWVSLMNLSGASYPDTELKLVAGNVRKVEPTPRYGMNTRGAVAMAADSAGGFEEKSFLEYHMYTLPRRTDVLQNSTQQIALFEPVTGVTVTKELVLDLTAGVGMPGSPMMDRDFVIARKGNPAVRIVMRNSADNRMGMPLPAGKVRVYAMDDGDGTLDFVGEDVIGHTPRNEVVKLNIGEAFDIVGERTRTDFSVDTQVRRASETFAIEIRNQKATAERIRLIERPYRWSNWTVADPSHPFTKVDSGTIAFDLEAPAEGSVTVRYTVKYSW
jgi:hypothetical protein